MTTPSTPDQQEAPPHLPEESSVAARTPQPSGGNVANAELLQPASVGQEDREGLPSISKEQPRNDSSEAATVVQQEAGTISPPFATGAPATALLSTNTAIDADDVSSSGPIEESPDLPPRMPQGAPEQQQSLTQGPETADDLHPFEKKTQQVDLSPLPADDVPTPEQVESGPTIAPDQRIGLYDSGEWERFILEWAHTLNNDYARVRRFGGSGDEGRDIVAYVTHSPQSPFDVYQCKHYADPLAPSKVWVEIGKVCWYTFKGHYLMPRSYIFVAPKGCGTALLKLLEKPDKLKQGLLDAWEDSCKKSITKTSAIEMSPELRLHIDKMDFSIFVDKAPHEIIEQHRRSPRHIARFGGNLPHIPPAPPPSAEISPEEQVYVAALLEAYSESHGAALSHISELSLEHPCRRHFSRAREQFYDAEVLRALSRDQFGERAYLTLLDNVYHGVIDVVEDEHPNGFVRVKQAVQVAMQLDLQADLHVKRMTLRRRGGSCHQLANMGRVKWVKK